MIKIERTSPPKGTVLDRKKEEEYQKIETQRETAKPQKLKFKSLWSDSEVKEFLHRSQHGKCCYCERKRDRKRESDVEHFRPKGRVEENDKHPGYWWLAYEWNNLLIACKKCNEEVKKAKFPLMDEDNRVFDKTGNIDKEEPYLLNPLKENPEDFIAYDIPEAELGEGRAPLVKAIGKDKRGQKTVDELTGINSIEVQQERAEKLEMYGMLLELVKLSEGNKVRIAQLTASEKTFAGFARFYFKSKGYL